MIDTPDEKKRRLLALLLKEKGIDPARAPIVPLPRGPASSFPLSFAQERLWVIDQLEPGNIAYNLTMARRLEGRLDPELLSRVFTEIVRRHETLRTTFGVGSGGRPVQVISPPAPVLVPRIDLADLPEEIREAELRRLAIEEGSAPFDLARGPVLRVRLVRLATEEHALLLTLHHIASDGWSNGVLVGEVVALYDAFSHGRPSPLPPLPVQYADYASWQRQAFQGDALEKALAWWRERLADAPVLELPTDRPRPAVQGLGGSTVLLDLPAALAGGLKALARAEGTTLFMAVTAACQALLARLSGQRDLTVGTPVANRHKTEIEGLIGFFVNTLVLRTDLSGDPPFRELLARVRRVAIGAFEHGEVPFSKVVEEVRPERSLSHTPLFQVMCALGNAPSSTLEIPGLRFTGLDAPVDSAMFDLNLSVADSPDGLAAMLEYRTDLFDRTTALRLLGAYATVLEAVVSNPDLRLSELPLLTPLERQALLVEWNDPAGPEAAESLEAALAASAKRNAEKSALVFEGRSFTFREVDERASRLAGRLRGMGVGPGTLVGLSAERSPETLVRLFAVLKAGAAYVPLDPAYPAERLAFMLEDSGVTVLLDKDFEESEDSREGREASLQDLAYVIYTSGSTGRPKGVGMPRGSVANLLAWQARHPRLAQPARTLQFTSLSFDVSFQEIVSTWITGGTLVLVSEETRRDFFALLDLVDRERVERLFLPFVALRQLAEAAEARGRGGESLRDVVTAGEQLQATRALRSWFGRLPECRLHNQYGPTESHVVVTALTLSGDPASWPALPSIGRPIARAAIRLLDPALQPVPVGVPGEIHIGGPALARGYLDRPDLTAERFVPDPFPAAAGARLYRTGDLARWLPDGTIEYLGRRDGQVKVRGVRVETGEVETALDRHPGVRQAVVVSGPEPGSPGALRLVAFYVPAPGVEPGPAELREFLAARLPGAYVPSVFVPLEAFPTTPSGKVDRKALATGDGFAGDSPGAASGYVPPRTQTEELLAGVWEALLGIERVGVHDNFFELGGHSLLATQLVSRVREVFRVEIPQRALFEAPTVGELARVIEAASEGPGAALLSPIERVPGDGPFPLSFAQERLWLVEQIDPGNAAYNMAAALRFAGDLQPALLAAVLDEVLRRHATLRTTYGTLAGAPVQIVHPAAPFDLPVIDLAALPSREAEARRLAGQEILRPFDLSRGPILRASLLRMEPGDHVLVFNMHHIASDGWSTGVLVREVMALYGGSPLPELPVRYVDYASWQRQVLQGEVLEAALGYWRERLEGVPVLELPTDRPRPALQSPEGAVEPLEVPAEVSEALKALGRRQGATLFMTLTAAFEALLSRSTGQTDFGLGTPVAGRGRVELEDLIGFFVNTLVIRADLGGDPPFSEILARVREASLGAFAHQEVPFERIVEELHPARSLSHSPLFQAMFVLQNAPGAVLEIPGLTAVPFEAEGVAAKFDLTLSVADTEEGFAGGMEYRTSLFDAATVRRLLVRFNTLLAGIVAGPDRRLSELPLLSEAERREIAAWSGPRAAFPVSAGLHELFAAQAARAPEAVAVVSEGDVLTYGELSSRANRLARRLRRLGVGPESRVGLAVERSAGLIVAVLGILKAGGAYVPLDPSYPEERLAFLLADSDAPVLLTQEHLADRLPAHRGHVVLLDDPALEEESGEDLAIPVWPENAAYIIYTSGSTGRPKGTVVTHGNVVRLLAATDSWFGFGPEDVWTLFHSFAFDFSVWEIWGALLFGGRLVVVPFWVSRSPEAFLDLLVREGVTVLNQTPSAFRQLVAAEEERGGASDLALRLVIFGGEALDLQSLAPWLDRHGDERPLLVNMYGITETTVHVTYRPISRADLAEPWRSPVGVPIPDLSIHLLDPSGQPVPGGAPGEMAVGGAGLARGYLGRPDLTAERYVPGSGGERLYRSGDLARWRPSGEIDYLGRIDHQVKVRGFRIELGEIEAALAAHPAVREAVVLVRDEADDRRLVAYLGAGEGEEAPSAAELRGFVSGRLPDYMVPAAFVILPSLPLTPHGKVDRRALAEIRPEGGPDRAWEPPETVTEAVLASLWAEVLAVPRVGVSDDFFALGGHSLLGTRLVARVREAFGVGIPLRALFEGATVRDLARRIASAEREDVPPIVPVPRGAGPLPLSFSQERLWLVDQIEPGTATYNMPSALRLAGPLRPGLLAAVFAGIVRRHEVLRTTFRTAGGAPVQVVHPPASFPLPVADLGGLPEDLREEEARRLAAEEVLRPFDLARGPVLRAGLLRLGAEDHVLLFTLHHIAADGWSVGVLVREVMALYGSFSAGRPSPLPELPVQYADYAVWQRRVFGGERLAASLGFWRERLAGVAVLEMPTDRPRPAVQTAEGDTEPLEIPAGVAAALGDLGRREGATLFMVLAAAWEILLSRYSAQTDFAVGTPVAGRDRVELEGLIGFFVNTLVLRADLGGDPPFRELLGRVREGAFAAFARQEVPFERLVEELQPDRSLSHSPLFQVMLVLQNAPAEAFELPGLTPSPFDAGAAAAKFDLTLSFVETGEGLAGALEYRTSLFDAATIRRLLGHLGTLLTSVAAEPGRSLSDLPLMPDSERIQVLCEWSRTETVFPETAPVAELFARQMERTPEAVAVASAGETLTYRELARQANRLARRLARMGVRPEVPVALLLDRSPAQTVAALAVVQAGGAYVPLDPGHPAERLAFILADTAAPVVVTEERLLPLLPEGPARVLCLDRDRAEIEAEGAEPLDGSALEDALLYVMYTSGSTGTPKGVAVVHRGVARLARWAREELGVSPGDVLLQLSPFVFDGSTLEIWGAILNGATVAVPPPGTLSREEIGREVGRHGVTALWLTAGLFHQMAEGPLTGLASLRLLLAGGDVLSAPHVRRVLRELPGTAFGNGYGPTENTTGTACALFTGMEALGASVPIGRPLSGTRVFLLGPDGQPVPLGIPGELCAGGQGLARGYLGRPERTAESFVPDPFADSPGERLYRTGDLARFLPDGRLDFLGRIDRQVKIRGFRVEPGEVEAVLAGHPEVAECAVVLGRDGAGKRLVACVVPRDSGAAPSTADLRAWLGARLPEPLVPAAFVTLPSLPLNANGKVDRRALGRIAPETVVRSGGIEPPRTPAEALLAGLWAEVLGLPEVGIRDDFFDLGGHSLLGTRLVSRVRETFGVELPLRALFEAPTVEALVAHIKAAGEDRALPALVAEPRDTLPPLSFAQERLWVVDQLEPGGTAYNLPSAQRLLGALRPDVLTRVFAEIARRHETLRTTFDVPEAGALPVQIVAPPSAVHLPVVDLAALPSKEREAEVRRLATEEGGRPFDLVHGPVWRATLVRLAEREHALLVTMHHIASDGWSLGVLSKEVAALYEAFSAGQPSPLPELPVQYADYAVRERRLFAAGAMEASLEYWKRQLAEAPVLELPTDRPRSASPGSAAGVEALDLPADLSAALNAFARQGGATLFMGMTAAWEALLSRYTGQEDLTVGTPVAGRLRTELEPLIGFFVNTLVLRADLSGDPSFREVLARTRNTALAAFAHQEVPFERLVLELNPERSLAQTPLFQVMASLHNMPAAAAEIPGLAFLPLETAGATAAKFDLTLAATETGEGLALALEYRATLFDAATIRRMLAHFATLVTGIAADPGARLSELPLFPEAERWQVLSEWSQTEAVFPETVPLTEDFERQVRETPEALALASTAESLTYRELDRRANRLARKLRRLGVGPEVPVGLFLDRSIGRIVATLAVVKAGGAYVPLDPAHPAERLAFVLADTAAPVVVTDAGLLPALPASSARALCLDRDREEIEEESGEPLGVRVSVDALLYVMYTSGSTGTPKGVAVVHRGVSRLVRWGREVAGFGPGDVLPQLASYAFDASTLEVWGTLLSGATLTVPPPGTLSLEEIGREAARHGATILWLTTGLFHQMAEGDLAPLSRLRLILTGGDVTSAPHVRRTVEELPGTSLIVAYGPTENSSYTSTFPAGREPMGASVPLGRPISGTRVIVLDRAGQPVPIGVPGELCTGGDGVARGYLGRPERTAEAFVPDPFADSPGERLYRTGDLARFLPDGRLDFLGRIDQQVKIRGFRVEPGEVEAVLAGHPEIAECAVVVGKDAAGKRLVACVVPRDPEAPPATADLRAWLGARLPEPLVPAAFVTLPTLPLSTSGKVDRRALARISPEPVRSGGIEAPRTGTEALLAELWAEVLGVPAVGIRDGFFDLGGHSLLATRLVSRVRQVFGVDLPLRDLFEGPTVAELARRVEAGERGSAPPIVPVPRDGGPLPLSFTQERLWFLDQLDPGTPTLNMPGSFRLPGDLDAGTLSRALDEVVRRHESLRTTFGSEAGTPFQRIAPPFSLPLPVVDLSGLAPEAADAEAGRIGAGEAGLSFDLARGPLLRTLLLRRGEGGWTLLLTLHHIVSDGWSMGLLTRELGALYRSSAALPAPPVQYADYAVWQRRWLSGEKLAAQIAYWRGKLADAPVLDLPTDRPRPAVQTYRGASVPYVLSPDLSARLAALARREGATLFMVLLAAFQTLLSRLSGQEDVIVGSPVAGRVRAEVEGLIGCFLNNLALRTDLSGNPSFCELLGRARATALEAYAHQDIPFEKLLKELSPKRDLSRTPVFQVFLNMLNFPADEGGLAGAGEGGTAEVASKFDLTIYAAEAAGEIRLDLVYNADLFDRERVEEMAAQLERILARAAEDPETRIAGISLVTEAARAVLPDPARPLDAAFRGAVPEALARHAAEFPERVAVADAGTVLTYGELAAAAEGLAGLLASQGVGRGDVVAVWAHRNAHLPAAVLGVLRAGAAFLILDPAYPPSRLVDYLRIGRPGAFVAVAGAAPPPPEVAAELPEVRIERPAAGLPAPPMAVGPDDLAVVTFTSGSTGRPKGVAGRHGPLTHFYPWMAERFGLSGDDRFGMLSALSHDPLQRDLFTPVWLGGALSVPDPERIGSPGYLADWVRQEGVTVLHLTPAMLELLVQAAEETGVEMPSLRRAFVVGDLLKRTDVERLYRAAPGVTCINLYGSTETQRSVSYFVIPREAHSGREVLPLGRGMEGAQLLVLNPAGELAGIGELGEIHLRSAHLARGYLDDPALTAERFLPGTGEGDRIYRTGDLGRYRPDGNAELAGRADAQVKIRGFRIEPGEIEAALARFPGVREGVVIVREDRPGDRRLAAYAVPRPGAGDLSPDDIRVFLAGRLPAYMVPADVVVLPALPLTRTGKVDRRALPAPERTAGEGIVTPRTPTEETLAGLWRDLLDIPEVSVHDDFFDLGGHSLLATRLLSRVRSAFGIELPLRSLFEAPTLEALAARIETAEQESLPPILPVPRDGGPLPLSFAQERLWFLDRLDPGTPTLNLPGSIRLRGVSLSPAALARAVAEAVRRHEALRTTFGSEEGRPFQRVAPEGTVLLPVADLRKLPPEARRREAARLEAEEALLPFDLERGPLLRARLLRLEDDDWAFLLTLHHVISDGWSKRLLERELGLLYGAFTAGRPSPLPPLPVQYADYAVWQRGRLPGDLLDVQLAYWRRQLEGSPVLDLPTDRPRPAVQTYRGASVLHTLGPELSGGLAALARKEGATLFMVLLAGFAALLSRLSGQEDVVVGSPIAGRVRSEIEGVVGCFLNNLALRTDLAGAPSFRELLRRARTTALEAYAHQDVPFERLLEELRPERDLSRTPVFQVLLNMLNLPAGRGGLAGGVEDEGGVPETPAKFDLTIYAAEAGGKLHLHLVYNADLFDRERIAEMAVQLELLLTQGAADPEAEIGEIPLATPAARAVLPDPAAGLPFRWPGSIPERVARQALESPEAVAAVDRSGAWTYGQLDGGAGRLAGRLRAAGVRPGDVVAVHARRGAALGAALLGVWKAGAAFVILDPAYPAARLASVVALARPAAWVFLEGGDAPASEVEEILAAHPRMALPETADGWERTLAGTAPASLPVEPHGLAYLAFTSGSTGVPKGIAGTHAPLSHFLDWQAAAFNLGPEDRVSVLSGLAHDPLLRDLFAPLWTGGTLCVPDPGRMARPGWLSAWMARERVTVAHLTPAMGQLLAQDAAPGSLPELRLAFFAGDVLTGSDLSRIRRLAPAVRPVNFYGATETPQAMGWFEAAGGGSGRVPIGRGIEGVQLLILNRSGRLAGLGELGEIHVRTPYLAQGYLGEEERTRESFLPDPGGSPSVRLYRTGDLGRYRLDGNAEIAGRADAQIKIRGFRVEPEEVEAAALGDPGVRECAVVAREDLPGDRRLVAYVVPEPGVEVTASGLRSFLAALLPGYMVPTAVVTLPALPLTRTGKLDRHALPAPERVEGEIVLPRTPEEARLAEIWRDLLGVERIGVYDGFFDLGGHSLLATRLLSRVQEAFGIELPLRVFFERPTIEGMAAELAQGTERGPSPSLVRLAAGGPGTPFFCVHPAGGTVFCYADLARELSPDRPFYGLQSPGVQGGEPRETIEEMATSYLEEVLAVQPVGPYLLGGWSLGGAVAFEMARQLARQGREVGLVAILDTRAPGTRDEERLALLALGDADFALERLAEELGPTAAQALRDEAGVSPDLPAEERLERILAAARRAGLLPADLGTEPVRRLIRIYRTHIGALGRYRPGPYAGRALLVRATEGAARQNPTLGWHGLLTGDWETVDVPGTHQAMMAEPAVHDVARLLRDRLRKVDG